MKTNNVHTIRTTAKKVKVLLISDLHWDNPHCDRELLRDHLEEAKKGGNDILINGDMFCLMQGKYDGRRSKSEIRPEHNNSRYLDSVVDTAVDVLIGLKSI
jgi:UDP-2,3-diacylglucosamine pyrophosphatase LpxH